jgi:hypothetical protein
MTEQEWLGDLPLYRLNQLWETSPQSRIQFFRRKLRLVTCALWKLGSVRRDNRDTRIQEAIDSAENGRVPEWLFRHASEHWQSFLVEVERRRDDPQSENWQSTQEGLQEIREGYFCYFVQHWGNLTDVFGFWYDWLHALSEGPLLAAGFCRDVFGNPFRQVELQPRWRTSDTIALAQAIYDDRDFERLPIIGDALMDAGCEDEQIIGHCRSDGPHVRGCWVVDLVLNKQ